MKIRLALKSDSGKQITCPIYRYWKPRLILADVCTQGWQLGIVKWQLHEEDTEILQQRQTFHRSKVIDKQGKRQANG